MGVSKLLFFSLGRVRRCVSDHGQGVAENESRTQVPYPQLHRIPVLLHNVTVPHLLPRVERMVIRLRIETELLKIRNDIKEGTGTFPSWVTFTGKIIPSRWGTTFSLNFLEYLLTR